MSILPPLSADQPFRWPHDYRAAVSVSFDDARPSQLDQGIPILDRHGVKGTFYVKVNALLQRLDQWKTVARHGHEIGNHSQSHACSGNFPWCRHAALEDFTLQRMATDIDAAQAQIQQHLGLQARSFAYPCGQTFIGRGTQHQSYVPLIAERFLVGRGFNNQYMNNPGFCDPANLGGADLDEKPFPVILDLIQQAIKTGAWLVLVGHDVGPAGRQTALTSTLDELCRFCCDRSHGLWIDTVANVGQYLYDTRRNPSMIPPKG